MAKEKTRQFAGQLRERSTLMFNVLDGSSFEKRTVPGGSGIDQEHLDTHHGGDLFDYIESVLSQGHEKIILEPRLKNGTSSKPAPIANITISRSTATETGTRPEAPSKESQKTKVPVQVAGKEIPMDPLQAIEGLNAIRELSKVERELENLKTEHARTVKERDTYKERSKDLDRDKRDLERDKKSLKKKLERKKEKLSQTTSGLNGMMQPESLAGITELIRTITPIATLALQAKKGKEAVDTGSADTDDFRQDLLEIARSWPKPFIEILNRVVHRIADQDSGEQFIAQLQQLLDVQILKKVENDG